MEQLFTWCLYKGLFGAHAGRILALAVPSVALVLAEPVARVARAASQAYGIESVHA